MFLKYFEPLFQPFRWVRSKVMGVQNVRGRVRFDVNRVKSYKELARSRAHEAKEMAARTRDKARGKGQAIPQPAGAGAGVSNGRPPGGMGAAPMAFRGGAAPGYARPGAASGGSASVSGTNGIVVRGALWWRKHLCAQCGQRLDKTWDRCPYCTGGLPVSPSRKTQAIMMDAAGAGNGLQLIGWLVALKGPQRGELFTLEPVTSVGTDPACTVVLTDSYMSSRHCEICAEAGTWVLRDLKSTNGTFVNDKRVEQHELVDSDFVRIGQSVLKFKSL